MNSSPQREGLKPAKKKIYTLLLVLSVLLLITSVAYAQDGEGHRGEGRGQGRRAETMESTDVDTSMTIHEIAEATGIRGSTLAHELGLPIDIDADTPLSDLGIPQNELERAVHHELGHHHSDLSGWKYAIHLLIVLFAALFLLKLGIPRGADPKKPQKRYPQWVYAVVLAVSVIVLAFRLGKSPNPMEAVFKVTKAMVGIYDRGAVCLGAAAFSRAGCDRQQGDLRMGVSVRTAVVADRASELVEFLWDFRQTQEHDLSAAAHGDSLSGGVIRPPSLKASNGGGGGS